MTEQETEKVDARFMKILKPWGNGMALYIDQEVAKIHKLKVGDIVEVTLEKIEEKDEIENNK